MLSFQPETLPRGQVLYVPPFAEEMNRCRSLVATLARQFADRGYGCTLLDLYGTGDSDGEFHQASLDDWLSNVALALTWVQERFGAAPLLWGLRLGALLAWESARAHGSAVAGLLLMQPATSGRMLTRQLVRQRIASGLSRNAQESAEDINACWERGDTVEIGGYHTCGELMLALQGLAIHAEGAPAYRIQWLEHESVPGKGLPPASGKITQALGEQGSDVSWRLFGGAPFWQLNERADTPELIGLMAELYR